VSKICRKRGFGWSRSCYSRETMRDSSLARSLVSQGWSREKSRSRKKALETLRDLTLVLDSLADTTSSRVGDMTETCRQHVADTTQNVAVWAKKRHADIRHVELRLYPNAKKLSLSL